MPLLPFKRQEGRGLEVKLFVDEWMASRRCRRDKAGEAAGSGGLRRGARVRGSLGSPASWAETAPRPLNPPPAMLVLPPTLVENECPLLMDPR